YLSEAASVRVVIGWAAIGAITAARLLLLIQECRGVGQRVLHKHPHPHTHPHTPTHPQTHAHTTGPTTNIHTHTLTHQGLQPIYTHTHTPDQKSTRLNSSHT